jgi:DNA processing protein
MIHSLSRTELEKLTRSSLPTSFPPSLNFTGNPEILSAPRVAIVGSRHPTYYGRSQAHYFAQTLASAGVTILSGAAIGIDTIVNSTALASGNTVAVLGSGLNMPYPRSNKKLIEQLGSRKNSLVLSELDPYEPPARWNFPRRNRIIAALSHFVLVIEAIPASGSLITAGFAAEIGVDVGALPGPVNSVSSSGCNLLIKEGAFCIEKPEEILERLGFLGHQMAGCARVHQKAGTTHDKKQQLLF